jgi:hypothetical protein
VNRSSSQQAVISSDSVKAQKGLIIICLCLSGFGLWYFSLSAVSSNWLTRLVLLVVQNASHVSPRSTCILLPVISVGPTI